MKAILVGNWKNYPETLKEAKLILSSLSRYSRKLKKVSTYIAPPTVFLEIAKEKSKNFANLASQDITISPDGTHTGLVTIDMFKSLGVKLSIIGHSERRKLGETNKIVSEKVRMALGKGITPLVCVGEENHDQDGNYFQILNEQIRSSLDGLKKKEDAKKIIIAYEPVWAIGKNSKGAMEPSEVSQMVVFIKKVLTEMFGRKIADNIAILYGGSVDKNNASELFENTGIKGFLIGRASLDSKSFVSIAESLIK